MVLVPMMAGLRRLMKVVAVAVGTTAAVVVAEEGCLDGHSRSRRPSRPTAVHRQPLARTSLRSHRRSARLAPCTAQKIAASSART